MEEIRSVSASGACLYSFLFPRNKIEAEDTLRNIIVSGSAENTITIMPASGKTANKSGRMRRQVVRLIIIKRAFASMQVDFYELSTSH